MRDDGSRARPLRSPRDGRVRWDRTAAILGAFALLAWTQTGLTGHAPEPALTADDLDGLHLHAGRDGFYVHSGEDGEAVPVGGAKAQSPHQSLSPQEFASIDEIAEEMREISDIQESGFGDSEALEARMEALGVEIAKRAVRSVGESLRAALED
ncbi:hypothetical protein B5C34_07150 [Pacificimonas flava]|uniref:Uncharacterized protein n=2 Tax=Pacificimonas TaxID=1960290 RepID=A0A219B4H1_9SPHN|nr:MULTISPECIES: hypothetical protein [Pacificimonas]MBZ6379559.1 hypothetical protein [Pacificimonas aurantium]OWV33257.1 hypothetical protein B5C34_07150 [Pacificimonas flava]